MTTSNTPCFGLWFSWSSEARCVTVRCLWRLFQVKRVRDELFSQRQDRWRLRLFGWSVKLFGR